MARLVKSIVTAARVVLLTAALISPARADVPDVVVYCDLTLAPAMRDVGDLYTARGRTPVHVFSATPTLLLAQLAHHVQADVLVTQVPWMDQAEEQGLIQPSTRIAGWRNHLVIAGKAGATNTNRSFALTDPTPATTIDGSAVLQALGLQPRQLIGAANSNEVVFLLTSGAAERGLLYLTDVRSHPALVVLESVSDTTYQPIVYTAALNRPSTKPSARDFLDFLKSPQTTERLRANGLEIVP